MILAFSDLHLGVKTYSKQQIDGLFTAECEARVALEEIYQRISKPDISLIIFCGDWFDNNIIYTHPSFYFVIQI